MVKNLQSSETHIIKKNTLELGMMVIQDGLNNIRKKLDMLPTIKKMVSSSCHGTNMQPILREYLSLFINHMVDMHRKLSPSHEECSTTT